MILIRLLTRAGVAGLAFIMLSIAPAGAQEISASHMAAAKEAAGIARTFQQFDLILPYMSRQVQDRLIRLRPDLYQQITQTVEETALKLAGARAELDQSVAKVWADAYTEEELNDIIAFYKSPAGQKFMNQGPQVVADTKKAVQDWTSAIADKLLAQSREALKAKGVEF